MEPLLQKTTLNLHAKRSGHQWGDYLLQLHAVQKQNKTVFQQCLVGGFAVQKTPAIITRAQDTTHSTSTSWRWKRCPPLSASIVQELCESPGGHPGLSILPSFLVSVDVKLYWTMLQHWSQLVPNMSTDIQGHQATQQQQCQQGACHIWELLLQPFSYQISSIN